MGISNFIKTQFIEIIEWTDNSQNILAYRFPVDNKEIKMGAQLIVRQSQVAIFVNEGQIADIFTPGKYTLSTQNIPVLTKIKSWKYGFNSPFKAEVYFVNTKQFTDQKWGTANPIMMRDAEFGMVRLRARGIFSFRVSEADKFLNEVFGTNQVFETEKIVGQLKRQLISGLADLFAESKIPALDLAMNYDELSEAGKEKSKKRFEDFGLELVTLYIENITLPPEVEKAMDKRTSMGVIGNVNQYAQFQAADALRDAAQNSSGGLAGAGVGLGAGAAMGNMMGQVFNNNQQQTKSGGINCPSCGIALQEGAKFCSNCGKQIITSKDNCIKCNAEIDKSSKFCSNCGTEQIKELFCTNCGCKQTAGTKFCSDCGNKME